MKLSDNTKMNIIRGGALALVLLFFFAPLVRWTHHHWMTMQQQHPPHLRDSITRVAISGWEYAIGAGTITSRPLIFVLLIIPAVLFALSWVRKSYEVLATISLGGMVAQIIFVFWYRSLTGFQNNSLEFTGFTWLILALYAGIAAFALYCAKEKGKAPKQAVIGVLKTAVNSVSNFAQSVSASSVQSTNMSSTVCAGCGAELDQSGMFCGNCGQKAAPLAPPAAPTNPTAPTPQLQLTCTGCGTALEPGDKFCDGCGQKIAGGIPYAPSSAVTSAPPVSTPAASPPAPSAASSYAPPQPAQPIQQPHIPPSPLIPTQSRMPLIFLLDTSASASPFISQLASNLNRFKSEVNQDTQAGAILDVSIIQFNDSPYVLQPYLPVVDMKPVRLIAGGYSMYSAAIQEALRMAEDYTRANVNHYKPWIILITNGGPADDISAIADAVQSLQQADKLRFMALGTQGYDAASLKRLTDVVFRQDGNDYAPFFNWISKCMWAIAKTSPGEKPQLPALEGNVYRDR